MIADPGTDEGAKRLEAMVNTCDGFELARVDLAIRGPGEFWGVRQHGLHQLKVADLVRDQGLVEITNTLGLSPQTVNLDQSVLKLYIKNKFNKSDEIAAN
jgi:ATP-dependent DNA helicase RecG